MHTVKLRSIALIIAALGAAPHNAWSFDSGSTGADGDLIATVSREVEVPASGVLQYKSITVAQGARLTFKRNTANTPVTLLVQGNVTVAGIIDVSGGGSPNAGLSGDGNVGDDGLPGLGGPGGYDGGQAGPPLVTGSERGSDGVGPGGGQAGRNFPGTCVCGAGGGGYGAAGASDAWTLQVKGGAVYGSAELLPLIGGSGGGGGGSNSQSRGSGGAGGGGAILIAATGTVDVQATGQILANGGSSGQVQSPAGQQPGSAGGGGSGGSIRIVATRITGEGSISAAGGVAGQNLTQFYWGGGNGGVGRIRLEAETFTRTSATSPFYTASAPGPLFLQGSPTLRIARVAGVAAPAQPTGRGDLLLPASLSNPVSVEVETVGVPLASIVKVTVTPANAAPVSVDSSPLVGSTTLATASASVTLPPGPSVLLATLTYQVNLALGEALSRYAQNEQVESVRLAASLGTAGSATLITTSGKEYAVPLAALALGSTQ